MDRIEHLRTALRYIQDTGHAAKPFSLERALGTVAEAALFADDRAAAAQDEANEQHHAAEAETVYGWSPAGFIRELGPPHRSDGAAAVKAPTKAQERPWLVITHDYYDGYQIVQYATPDEAMAGAGAYPEGIVTWDVWVAEVVAGKDPR